MQGIEKRLEALGEKLGFQFETSRFTDYIRIINDDGYCVMDSTIKEVMYNLLVYTNYVASFEESTEAEPKSFTQFITSKEYNTDFEILTNHIIDTLVKDEE